MQCNATYIYLQRITRFAGNCERRLEKMEISKEVLKMVGNEWVSNTGDVRYYVNDWMWEVGVKVEYKNTHRSYKIESCEYKGETYSAKTAWKLKDLKVWVDSTGQAHVDKWDEGIPLNYEAFLAEVNRCIAERIERKARNLEDDLAWKAKCDRLDREGKGN